MGWDVPWFSSHDNDFNADFGVTTDNGETFGLSVFLCDDSRISRTYFTTRRGVEALGSAWTFLDLTPLGRQEEWEPHRRSSRSVLRAEGNPSSSHSVYPQQARQIALCRRSCDVGWYPDSPHLISRRHTH